jgi:putative Holliday junction resolvase
MPPSARFLGIDYGHRRIGLALSDPTGMLSRPWKTIARHGNRTEVASSLAAEVAMLVAEEDGLAGVILGYPRTLEGEPTDQTAAVTALADVLRARIAVPLVLQDERLSSREAESLLARRLKSWRDRKPLLDAASAAVILQDYLDSRAGVSGNHGEDLPS